MAGMRSISIDPLRIKDTIFWYWGEVYYESSHKYPIPFPNNNMFKRNTKLLYQFRTLFQNICQAFHFKKWNIPINTLVGKYFKFSKWYTIVPICRVNGCGKMMDDRLSSFYYLAIVQYRGKHSKILATILLLLPTYLNSNVSHYNGRSHYFFPGY